MRKRRRRFTFLRVLLFVVAVVGVGLLFRQGLVPARLNPLPTLRIDGPPGLFLDWQLAALRREPALCRAVLKSAQIDASPIPDNPLRDGCGWLNAVRTTGMGSAKVWAEPLSCEVAAAFAMWMTHDVQPLAQSMLGQRIVSVHQIGTYACRNIIGNPVWEGRRSEHATANAIDVAGFTLADGRYISIARHWFGPGPESQFLKAVHRRSCRYFRVSLGPDFNAAHNDHFHLDRGILWSCR
ncbi:MAG TPA: extensin family protein [Hyphomicrobiaceae bacterium]|nr:extensin family protein [Hyphomicrobiaceae bacterium]